MPALVVFFMFLFWNGIVDICDRLDKLIDIEAQHVLKVVP